MANRIEITPGLASRLARSPGMVATTRAIAELFAREAARRAPFPRIAARIEADVTVDALGARGRVHARDWISHFWEYGTIKHAARPFMRPAADMAGPGNVVRPPGGKA